MAKASLFVPAEGALSKDAVSKCREVLSGLVAELSHRGSAPADDDESSIRGEDADEETAGAGTPMDDGPGSGAGSSSTDKQTGELNLQDRIDSSARAALSWAGTCHAAIEDGLEALAADTGGDASSGSVGLLPIAGGSAALRARQVALAVADAFSEAASVLDSHGGAAIQQGRRMLLNGAASLTLSALACITETTSQDDEENDDDDDDDDDEEPDTVDLELCAATEDLAVALCRLLWPFVVAASDVEGGDGNTEDGETAGSAKKKSKSKKSPKKSKKEATESVG